jgi:thymidine kinase
MINQLPGIYCLTRGVQSTMVLKSQTAETAQTSNAAQPIGGAISKGYQARCRKCRKPPETFSHR